MSVLVATDFSESAENAVSFAVREANVTDGALSVVHCVDIPEDASAWTYFVDYSFEVSNRVTRAVRETIDENFNKSADDQSQPSFVDYHVRVMPPEEGILDVARTEDVHLIVLGATGMGRMENMIFGSTPEQLIRESEYPVLVVPRNIKNRDYQRILAPVDFSEGSRESLRKAFEVAAREGAKLSVLHVAKVFSNRTLPFEFESNGRSVSAYREQMQRKLDDFVSDAGPGKITWEGTVEVVEEWSTSVPAKIQDVIERDKIDLTVMGVTGRRGIKEFFVGGTTSKVLRQKNCPILTVPVEKKGR